MLEEHGPLNPPSSRPSYSVQVHTTGEALISDFSVQVRVRDCTCVCVCVCICLCVCVCVCVCVCIYVSLYL